MTQPISALDHYPSDFVREVSLEAIDFYAKGLSGLYMPESDERYFNSRERLMGKFGRFMVERTPEDEETVSKNVLLMGTTATLGPRGSSYGQLRHSLIKNALRNMIWEGIDGLPKEGKLQVKILDYGHTCIVVDEGNNPETLLVSGSSFDFGRADEAGRQRTCELFSELLGGSIKVDNIDPRPTDRESILQ